MNPYYQDNHITQYCMDFRKNDLPDECVQMVCTSPPYWGLRKYSGEQELIWGGSKDCEHQWIDRKYLMHSGRGDAQKSGKYSTQKPIPDMPNIDNACSLCGAWKGAFGFEPTPELYIQHSVEILREIRRVLRKDGVVFWNIGDSYFATGKGPTPPTGIHSKTPVPTKGVYTHDVLKPKDLCLIPFRVAIAAQEDGWWVRSVIIWSKPNPMPESVTDRPTESHEYILLLTKSSRYYWDADAVREPYPQSTIDRMKYPVADHNVPLEQRQNGWVTTKNRDERVLLSPNPAGRNIRSVWEFPTQPYPEAHFAVFPEKLPETCIKAATPEVGCCSKCGAPWERITKPTAEYEKLLGTWTPDTDADPELRQQIGFAAHGKKVATTAQYETLGWQPTCKCNADKVPSIVLDPFSGAGTTLWVAKKLGREAKGFDTSEEYCQLGIERNRQQVFNLTENKGLENE